MRHKKNYLGIILITVFGSMNVEAKLLSWKEYIPSSLNYFKADPHALADLAGDNILIYAHPSRSIGLPTLKPNQRIMGKYYSAAVVVPTSSKNIARLMSNYVNYAGLFPTLKSAKIIEQQGNVTQVRYSVHIPTPIPVLNFKENVVMQHHLQANSIASLIIDAPVSIGAGKIEWFELSENETLLTITQWGDLDQPKGFLFSKILNALPDAKLGIPSATNAFLLESIQRRFKPYSIHTLNAGEMPSAGLSSTQLLKVANMSQIAQEPVSFLLPLQRVPYSHGYEAMRFSSSYQHFGQTPSQLQHWVTAPAFQQLFPRQVKDIQIQHIDPQQLDANYKISVGLGVINIPFDFKMRFEYPTVLRNQFNANGGDLKFVQGAMQLMPQKQGTLMNVTSAMKIDDQAPLLLRAMRSLPYHDVLPALGGNTVFSMKVKQKLKSAS